MKGLKEALEDWRLCSETKCSLSYDSLTLIEAMFLEEKDRVLKATKPPFILRKMTWQLSQGKYLHLGGQGGLLSNAHVTSCLVAAF